MSEDKPLSYWTAVARISFEDDFARLFDELGISRSEFARLSGFPVVFISKVLNGTGNYRLETMVKLARSVGGILQISLIKECSEVVRIVDYETARTLDDISLQKNKTFDRSK